jgi:hypothetical protein
MNSSLVFNFPPTVLTAILASQGAEALVAFNCSMNIEVNSGDCPAISCTIRAGEYKAGSSQSDSDVMLIEQLVTFNCVAAQASIRSIT